jgi:sugar phosphate isomerase/epimerase
MQQVLEKAGRDDVACCWDIKHTYWVAQEVPELTWARLSRWVRNTHWKDVHRHAANPCPGDERIAGMIGFHGVLCPVGEGIAPLVDAVQLMARDGYSGWYTLEWEKAWHPYIAEPEISFPGFVAYMRDMEQSMAALR